MKVGGKTVHMLIDGVIRVGEYLAGTLMLTASERVYVDSWEFLMPPEIEGSHSWAGWMMGVYNLTLLSAGQRYLGVDYSYSVGDWVMLSNDSVFEIQPGESTRFPVVWQIRARTLSHWICPRAGASGSVLLPASLTSRSSMRSAPFALTGMAVPY